MLVGVWDEDVADRVKEDDSVVVIPIEGDNEVVMIDVTNVLVALVKAELVVKNEDLVVVGYIEDVERT